VTQDELIADARARLEMHFCPRCLDGDLRITVDPATIVCSAGCADVADDVYATGLRLTGDSVRPQREALLAVAVAASQKHPRSTAPASAATRTRIAMSSIQPRDVEWLWANRIPRGSVVSIDGLPASGKSSLATELVACVTTGRALYGDTPTAPRSAIWIGHEEGLATALRPRLDAARADASRVFVYADPPSFPGDYEWLADQIRETAAVIVVIDPIDGYLDFGERGDSHRNGDVRARLVGLGAVAERTGATIVMIRHWRKSGGTHALYRAAGSIAYSALARATVSVAVDPDDPYRRLAAWAKMSDAPEPTSIAFRLGAHRRVEWIGDDPRSATALMAAADSAVSARRHGPEAATATDAAEEFLTGYFAERGEVPEKELLAAGLAAGHSGRRLRAARERLGIKSRRVNRVGGKRGEGEWIWFPTAPRRTDDMLPATVTFKMPQASSQSVLNDGDANGAPNAAADAELAPSFKVQPFKAQHGAGHLEADPAPEGLEDAV
jgi:RecA/RadA recombinase